MVLLKITGSSCSGKTTAAQMLGELDGVVVHDFDEVGVPAGADKRWRQEVNEHWVRKALKYQHQDIDTLLLGQSPLGELLATPSALDLNGIAVCLLDVDDATRRQRLAIRASEKWDEATIGAFIDWGDWHRRHAADPQYRPEVLIEDGWSQMIWSRWSGWRLDDRRWQVETIDSTGKTVADTTAELRTWVCRQWQLHQANQLPLQQGWASTGF